MRAIHWTFVACVAGAWLTRQAERVDLHAVFGYAALAALALRIAWGFAGPRHARFADFAYSPRAAIAYLREAFRGAARHYTGHNPAGSWSVWMLLGLLALLGVTGIAASAGLHAMGPLAAAVPWPLAGIALEAHAALAWAILGVAVLHVAGVAWGSRVHRENLALAMLTGRKVSHDEGPEAPPRTALAIALLAGLAAAALWYLALHVPRELQAATDAARSARARLAASGWGRECGSCHLAYVPALLPERSWVRTLQEQDRHFGEDLSLSPAAVEKLLAAARVAPQGWAAWKLASSVPPGEAPLRITELAAWRHMHARVTPERFKPPASAGPHDCEACHRDAASGIFHARMIRSTKPGTDP